MEVGIGELLCIAAVIEKHMLRVDVSKKPLYVYFVDEIA